jgi:thioester reductase-like protein
MMRGPRGVLLTGSTGLLGRFLLRDLLLANCRVSVLVRDAGDVRAADRIREIVDFWSEALGCCLPRPTVVGGDIREEGLGLTAADRRWLAVSCDAVIHSAANLSFRLTADGEPWATNFAGTQRLLDLCLRLGITEFHHVSTAFVCGESNGIVFEDSVERGQRFHNPYEESKYEAERLIGQATDIRSTVYRPSVIVGDSVTGHTSNYHGIYRFMEFAARLSTPIVQTDGSTTSRRRLDLRLPFTGDEPRNLVPVDWVAQAIIRLVMRPECHGRNYHLVSSRPTPARLIEEVAQSVLNLEGIRFAGGEAVIDRSPLERLFFEHLEEYAPYHRGDPSFDCRHLSAALPDLPAPPVDRELLRRLVVFARDNRWGRNRCARSAPVESESRFDCRRYIEQTFPEAAQQSSLARTIGLEVVVSLDVHGPTGGQWTLSWIKGELAEVRCGLTGNADVLYRFASTTFESVIRGKRSPQDAFFSKQIEVEGDIEKALKLAVLLGLFLAEAPAGSRARKETADALPQLA